jgi:hypothetical protein
MAAFAWREGDLLLLDNARVLHDGLPGVGPRKLHVALLAQQPECATESGPGGGDGRVGAGT